MRDDALQYRVHYGDDEAFAALCREHIAKAYRSAFAMLGDEAKARAAVKRALLRLRAEILAAEGPIDIDARLAALIGGGGELQEQDATPEPATVDAQDEVRYDGRKYKGKAHGYALSVLLAVLFAAVFFWLLFGALMRGGAIPFTDLGYTWFNEHVLGLFNIRI